MNSRKTGRGGGGTAICGLYVDFALCVRQALYINPQQSTVRLHGSKMNFES